MEVEHVTAQHLDRRRTRQSFSEADHAHVVAVLSQLRFLRVKVGSRLTFLVQAGQAVELVDDSAAEVTAREDLRASVRRVLLALLLDANIADRQKSRVAVDTAEPAAPDGVLRVASA